MHPTFHERTALVTGATSGIGRATALLLARQGARVIATGRNQEALDVLRDEASGAEAGMQAMAGDLRDRGFRERLVQFTESVGTGRLDVLVNAAGIIGSGTLATTAVEDLDHMMDVNLRAPFDLTRSCLPMLQEAKGAIVNVSSVTGTRAFPGVMAYCISKAAIDQFTRCLALEVASSGVRVNAVNPGVVRTNLHRNGGMGDADYAAFVERSGTTHPLGRVGEPEEVAALIAFLASDQAAWITGECVAVDGGRAQTCAR